MISVAERCTGGIPNSRSCGTVWSVDILSDYCHSYLPSASGVRDWIFSFLASFAGEKLI